MNYIAIAFRFLYIFLFINNIAFCQFPLTAFERNPQSSTTYQECIQFYKELAKKSKYVSIVEAGMSDVEAAIHTIIISNQKEKNYIDCKKNNKIVILINNGIHPGEPDGIDGSMIFVKELLNDKSIHQLLKKITIVIIPVYNVGGMMNRNNSTRANQNGPLEYGFRGNNQYLDLNRDFIKCDSRNAITFAELFQKWQPHLFIDTHTTDGADYPYAMTLISSQKDKMNPSLSSCMESKITPFVYAKMKSLDDEIFPYIDFEGVPDNGIYDFMDPPRYSSGYASIHHCMAYITESHMLKTHEQRCRSHIRILHSFVQAANQFYRDILDAKTKSIDFEKSKKLYTLKWELDFKRADTLEYKAYAIERPINKYTNSPFIYYNSQKQTVKKIPFYNKHNVIRQVKKPKYYVIHRAYEDVIQRLKTNGVLMIPLKKDSLVFAHFYKILDYKTPKEPYENHYLHSEVRVEEIKMRKKYFIGDFVIPMGYATDRFVIETLEPEAEDSYFAWNFFDGILQRKEYFSDYIFSAQLDEIFEKDPSLLENYQKKLKTDSLFKSNVNMQLNYLYSQSAYSEPYYRIYPVAKID